MIWERELNALYLIFDNIDFARKYKYIINHENFNEEDLSQRNGANFRNLVFRLHIVTKNCFALLIKNLHDRTSARLWNEQTNESHFNSPRLKIFFPTAKRKIWQGINLPCHEPTRHSARPASLSLEFTRAFGETPDDLFSYNTLPRGFSQCSSASSAVECHINQLAERWAYKGYRMVRSIMQVEPWKSCATIPHASRPERERGIDEGGICKLVDKVNVHGG